MLETQTREKLLLTVPDAAAALSVGKRTIWRLIASGSLRSVNIGRSVRIPADEVRRLAGAPEAKA